MKPLSTIVLFMMPILSITIDYCVIHDAYPVYHLHLYLVSLLHYRYMTRISWWRSSTTNT